MTLRTLGKVLFSPLKMLLEPLHHCGRFALEIGARDVVSRAFVSARPSLCPYTTSVVTEG